MTENEKQLGLFESKVRQLIAAYENSELERAILQEKVDELQGRVGRLELELNQSKNDFLSLQSARMLTITEGDHEAARKKLEHAIRLVDHCMVLLKGEEFVDTED